MLRLTRHAMGSQFEIILAGEGAEQFEPAAIEALDEVERLEERLSHYRPTSDISDLNRRASHEPVRLPPDLIGLLLHARRNSEETAGAFDITAGALIRCWGFFRGSGAMPDAESVEEARSRTGINLLEIDAEARTLRFLKEGVEVHLGAIGKGYAVDAAVRTLRYYGVESALVHGGTSTVYGLGAPPGSTTWAVGLRDPREQNKRVGVVRLRNRALSVSGDYEQYFEHEGRRYSHILDPRTGWPARGIRSAAMLSDNATDTDAYSTAAFVGGEMIAREICERNPGMGCILLPEREPPNELEIMVIGEADLASPAEFEEE